MYATISLSTNFTAVESWGRSTSGERTSFLADKRQAVVVEGSGQVRVHPSEIRCPLGIRPRTDPVPAVRQGPPGGLISRVQFVHVQDIFVHLYVFRTDFIVVSVPHECVIWLCSIGFGSLASIRFGRVVSDYFGCAVPVRFDCVVSGRFGCTVSDLVVWYQTWLCVIRFGCAYQIWLCGIRFGCAVSVKVAFQVLNT